MPAQAPHLGKWETVPPLLDTGQTAIHSCVIYNQSTKKWKVLYFYAVYREGPNNKVQSRIWNPENNQITSQDIPDWPSPATDPPYLFCSGHSFMPDGKLLVADGHRGVGGPNNDQFMGLPYTYIFDPINEQWSIPGPSGNPYKMADGRWYPTLTTLGTRPDGQISNRVIAMSGYKKDLQGGQSVVNKDPEVYDPNIGWRFMRDQTVPQPDAVQPFDDLYPRGHLIPFGASAGKIFYSIPMTQAYIFDPFFDGPPNGGFWTPVGGVRTNNRWAGSSGLLPLLPGSTSMKVLICGGGNPGLNTAEIIDLSSGTPTWTPVNPMSFARRDTNAVILPDDRILVIGGDRVDGYINPVMRAESYDPATGNWTLLPAMNIPRMYHSSAILLPDGRVWVGGTNAGGIVYNNLEIYSPGYLFEGTRPVFLTAPDNITYGSPFPIDVSLPIAAIRLIRLGMATHSIDMDQRSIGLSFTPGDPNGTNPYTVTPPANANVAPPGLYMLFVLRPKSASSSGQTMIPSVAKIVKLA